MNPKMRAHRILRHLSNYKSLSSDVTSKPEYLRNFRLGNEREKLIGVYENNPGDREDAIVIADQGIHILDQESSQRIDYQNISRIKTLSNKEEIDSVTIVDTRGNEVEIPVKGKKGKFRDALEFTRFLMRVTEDLRKDE